MLFEWRMTLFYTLNNNIFLLQRRYRLKIQILFYENCFQKTQQNIQINCTYRLDIEFSVLILRNLIVYKITITQF